MDMQNVSNLVIPEGGVKAIHDKDGNLLWGRLAYDTKYAGDTFQQTYSGKNLFNFGQFYANRADFTVNEGTINITETSIEYAGHTSSGSQFYPAHSIDNKSIYGMYNLQPSTTYTISYTAAGSTQCWVFFWNSSNTRTSVNSTFTSTTVSYTFTTPADLSWYAVRIDNRTTSNTISNIQIEVGSGPATSYEPYTGGQPAPNPAYPQPIQMVTGEQTITLSDGVKSDDYIINLGAIELCKIIYSDYQIRVDDLEKIGSSWYAHSLIYKTTLDGTENWETWSAQNQTNTYAVKLVSPSPAPANISGSTTYRGIMSDKFSWYRQGIVYTTDTEAITTAGGNIYIRINKNRLSSVDVDGVKAWLHDNMPVVYYLLATPTDTQITDTTLISQLDSVHEWLTRYGYTSTVTGSLPIVIDKTNL